MPKIVDHDERRREIAVSAYGLLGDRGFAGLTLRNLAERMGGSLTRITHYYPTREDLLQGILDLAYWETAQIEKRLVEAADPWQRLQLVVRWAMPLTEVGRQSERARVALVAVKDSEPAVQEMIDRLEEMMRGAYRDGLQDLVDDEHLDFAVDLVRSWVNGLGLSYVEHPETWTAERLLRVVEFDLTALVERLGRGGAS